MTSDASPGSSTPDGYSTTDAARLLGITPRRVRQLHSAGTLPAAGEQVEGAPLVLDREAVHRERESRKASRKPSGKVEGNATGGGLDAGDLLDLFARMQDQTLETLRRERAEVLAIRDRTEQDLRDALASERAARDMVEREAERLREEAATARAEVEALRAQVEDLSTPPAPDPEPVAPVVEKRRRWWQL